MAEYQTLPKGSNTVIVSQRAENILCNYRRIFDELMVENYPQNSFDETARLAIHAEDARFGFIVMGTNEALFGIVHGNVRDITTKFTVDLPKKRRCGGARAIRFGRIRKEKRQNYVRKISETAVQCFITDEKVNVDGIIFAHVAEFSTELHLADVFDLRIQAKLLQQVIIFYGGETGFNQAIDLASETLENVKFIQQKRILSHYFDEIFKDSGKYFFGLEATLKELEIGNVETLIIWENFDLTRYVLRNNQTEEMKIIYLRIDEEKEKANFQDKDTGIDLEQVEKMRLVDWFANNYEKIGVKLEIITDKSQEGSQFVHGFDGIGGILSHSVDRQSLDVKKNSEQMDVNENDYEYFLD